MTIRRRALTMPATIAVLSMASLIGATSAGAHVHVDADHPVRGEAALVTFQVPNESETGSATTKVTIDLPAVSAASTDVDTGWTAELDRDPATGAYRAVTFTAAPNTGIGAQQFELFNISIRLPDTDSVTFPVAQTYADGTTVRWDQPPLPNGGEPDYPAPVLALASGPHTPEERHPTPTAAPASSGAPAVSAAPGAGPADTAATSADNTARALAGGALLVAAIGVGVALARRRT